MPQGQMWFVAAAHGKPARSNDGARTPTTTAHLKTCGSTRALCGIALHFWEMFWDVDLAHVPVELVCRDCQRKHEHESLLWVSRSKPMTTRNPSDSLDRPITRRPPGRPSHGFHGGLVTDRLSENAART